MVPLRPGYVACAHSPQAWLQGRDGLVGGAWALTTGQDFIRNHSHDAIDYASIHAW